VEGKEPPRKIEFAPQDRIQSHQSLAREFFSEILDFDYDECFVTDESFVTDFDITPSEADRRIRRRYGIDVSDLLDGAIVDVLEAIEKRRPRLIRNN
jgi:hypothetical protein